MNRSRHALFNLLWTNLFQTVLHRPKMLLLLLLKKLNGKKLVRGDIGARVSNGKSNQRVMSGKLNLLRPN